MSPAQYRYMKRAMEIVKGRGSGGWFFTLRWPGRIDVGRACLRNKWVEEYKPREVVFTVTPAGRAAVEAYEKERER